MKKVTDIIVIIRTKELIKKVAAYWNYHFNKKRIELAKIFAVFRL